MYTAAISQPTYLPWLGYFQMINTVDTFIFLDTVQFEKQSWHSRNRIRSTDGREVWLSIPIARHPLNTAIKDIRICKTPDQWRRKHLRSIEMNYERAPYFDTVYPVLEGLLGTPWTHLADLTIAAILRLTDLIGLKTEFLRASDMEATGIRGELLVNLCREVGADTYIANRGSSIYLCAEWQMFAEDEMVLGYQDFDPPVYPQQGEDHMSHLSVIDALMNVGPEGTRALIEPTPLIKDTKAVQASR